MHSPILMKPTLLTSLPLLILIFSLLPTTTNASVIGVTYNTISPSSTHPPPDRVAAAVSSLGLAAVRLPYPDPAVVRSFAYTNTSLLLTLPNPCIPAVAANRSAAIQWLHRHVLPFYPRSRIAAISVGNDVPDTAPDISNLLFPALRNLHLALREIGIPKIAVSTTFSFITLMAAAFPPSSARFQQPLAETLIEPLLQFLDETNSSFFINIYPYNVYRLHPEIPIGYALFQEQSFNFRDDLATGVRYWNLFDMMVDAVISAMAESGHENIPVVVTETGWPSSGGGEIEATEANGAYAEMYLKGLVKHLSSGVGTPLRKEGIAEAYIYQLFDREAASGGGDGGRQWGILYQNMTRKYGVDFSLALRVGGVRGFVRRVILGFAFGFLVLFL